MVHQWIRPAIPDSQQPSSRIGFLFLKLPPPPCAVLLVYNGNMHRSHHYPLVESLFLVANLQFGHHLSMFTPPVLGSLIFRHVKASYIIYRRTFRSQTSDNTDRWGEESEKTGGEERRSEKRKSQKKEDAGVRKGRKVANHCVFQ